MTEQPTKHLKSKGVLWKRTFDIAVSLIGLTVCLPLLVLIALLIKLDSRGPVFFVQFRLGRYGRIFRLYKFRTMTDRPRDPTREILSHDPEVTAVGRFLRRFKIDELPQLWNVLKGDMSIVGPRPALPKQFEELDEVGKLRLQVRPGLTGLAQIHGNIYLPWQQRWKYDADYVKKTSFSRDCWILWRTLRVLLRGEQRYVKPLEK